MSKTIKRGVLLALSLTVLVCLAFVAGMQGSRKASASPSVEIFADLKGSGGDAVTLDVTVTGNSGETQVWVKKNIVKDNAPNLNASSYIWSLMDGFAPNNDLGNTQFKSTLELESSSEVMSGNQTLALFVKTLNGGVIENYYKEFTSEELNKVVVFDILLEGASGQSGYQILESSEVNFDFVTNIAASSYTVKLGDAVLYSSQAESGSLDLTEFDGGEYILTATAELNGIKSSKEFNVYIVDRYDKYRPFVSSVNSEIISAGSNEVLKVTVQIMTACGEFADYESLAVDVSPARSSLVFNEESRALSNGVMTVIFQSGEYAQVNGIFDLYAAVSDGRMTDTVIKRADHARASEMTFTVTEADGVYTLSANAEIDGIEADSYRFYREDLNGKLLISYGESQIEWKPSYAGEYVLYAQAYAADSLSFEAEKSEVVTVGSTEKFDNAELSVTDLNNAEIDIEGFGELTVGGAYRVQIKGIDTAYVRFLVGPDKFLPQTAKSLIIAPELMFVPQRVGKIFVTAYISSVDGFSYADKVLTCAFDVRAVSREISVEAEDSYAFGESLTVPAATVFDEFGKETDDAVFVTVSYYGSNIALVNGAFTPEYHGAYTATYSIEFEGETITKNVTLYVEYDEMQELPLNVIADFGHPDMVSSVRINSDSAGSTLKYLDYFEGKEGAVEYRALGDDKWHRFSFSTLPYAENYEGIFEYVAVTMFVPENADIYWVSMTLGDEGRPIDNTAPAWGYSGFERGEWKDYLFPASLLNYKDAANPLGDNAARVYFWTSPTGNFTSIYISKISLIAYDRALLVEPYGEYELGDTVTLNAATVVDSQLNEVEGAEYSVSVFYPGSDVTVTDGKFTAEHYGTYTVTYSTVYDGETYSREIKVVIPYPETREPLAHNVIEDFSHPTAVVNMKTAGNSSGKFLDYFAGENGVYEVKVLNDYGWHHVDFKTPLNYADYKDTYKYIVARMYFTDSASTGVYYLNFAESREDGKPVNQSGGEDSIVYNTWKDYYIPITALSYRNSDPAKGNVFGVDGAGAFWYWPKLSGSTTYTYFYVSEIYLVAEPGIVAKVNGNKLVGEELTVNIQDPKSVESFNVTLTKPDNTTVAVQHGDKFTAQLGDYTFTISGFDSSLWYTKSLVYSFSVVETASDTQPLEWEVFNSVSAMSSVTTRGSSGSTITAEYMDTYAGENGVVKFTYGGWYPHFKVAPKFAAGAYEDYDYIGFKIFIPTESDVVYTYIGAGNSGWTGLFAIDSIASKQAGTNLNGGTLNYTYGEWKTYLFDIKDFYFDANTSWFTVWSSDGNAGHTYYLSEIMAYKASEITVATEGTLEVDEEITVSASDNVNMNYTFIVTAPNGTAVTLTDGKFTATQAGTYTVKVYGAMGEFMDYTKYTFTVTQP